VGEARNAGCRESRGDLIAHWDDDDYSDAERLRDQVRRIVEHGKSVTGYRSMRFTDGARWWLYRGGPEYALGTSLCYRRDWWAKNPFPSVMVGEDNEFVKRARASSAIVSSDAGDLMYATIHPSNTSPRNIKGNNWKCLA
jgi:glycosyltransferase involved in cell wall biosynthesis